MAPTQFRSNLVYEQHRYLPVWCLRVLT